MSRNNYLKLWIKIRFYFCFLKLYLDVIILYFYCVGVRFYVQKIYVKVFRGKMLGLCIDIDKERAMDRDREK